MHKDQKIIQNSVIPALANLVVAEGDPIAERDCTVLARLLRFGPDPLYLMETAPGLFARLCQSVDITVIDGRKAIETAHEQGPASLFDGDLGINEQGFSSMEDLPVAHRGEVLWLLLASCSDCTEEGYSKTTTMLKRIQQATQATLAMLDLANTHPSWMTDRALESLSHFQEETEFTPDPMFGKPMSDQDSCFYVGFKQGHTCVAMKAGALTFYGTVPSTTLEAEGIKVDKQLSPSFGICFGDKP